MKRLFFALMFIVCAAAGARAQVVLTLDGTTRVKPNFWTANPPPNSGSGGVGPGFFGVPIYRNSSGSQSLDTLGSDDVARFLRTEDLAYIRSVQFNASVALISGTTPGYGQSAYSLLLRRWVSTGPNEGYIFDNAAGQIELVPGDLTHSSEVHADTFYGDGSHLTNLPSGGGGSGAINAANITSGTLDDARLSANVPLLDVSNNLVILGNAISGVVATSQIYSTSGDPSIDLSNPSTGWLLDDGTGCLAWTYGGVTIPGFLEVDGPLNCYGQIAAYNGITGYNGQTLFDQYSNFSTNGTVSAGGTVTGSELLLAGAAHTDGSQLGVQGDGSVAIIRVDSGDGSGDAAEMYAIPGGAGFQGFNRATVNTVPLRIVGGSAVFYTGDVSALNETMYLSPQGGVNIAMAGDPDPGLGNLALSGVIYAGQNGGTINAGNYGGGINTSNGGGYLVTNGYGAPTDAFAPIGSLYCDQDPGATSGHALWVMEPNALEGGTHWVGK